MDSLDNAEQATKDYNSRQMELFNNHKIYINNNGSLLIPQKEQYKQNIKDHISDIKNNKKEMINLITKEDK